MMQFSFSILFFFNDTATTEIYTLSLHDALPIWWRSPILPILVSRAWIPMVAIAISGQNSGRSPPKNCWARSEEHTSELQSRFDLVCRLLLEKKKKKTKK